MFLQRYFALLLAFVDCALIIVNGKRLIHVSHNYSLHYKSIIKLIVFIANDAFSIIKSTNKCC